MRAIGLRTMLLAGAGTLALAAPGWAQSACEGETLNLLMEQVTDTDAVLTVVPDFEAQTGADVEIEAVNYSLMHEKLVPSLLAAEGDYDVLQVDNYWVGEFVQAGWLEPLDERIAALQAR